MRALTLALLFVPAATVFADSPCLTPAAIVHASEGKDTMVLMPNTKESFSSRINETLGIFDNTAPTLEADRAAVAASLYDAGLTPRQLTALEEKIVGETKTWNNLEKGEQDLLGGIESTYLQQLNKEDFHQIRAKLKDHYFEDAKPFSAKQLADPEEVARDLYRTYGSDSRSALDRIKKTMTEKIASKVRDCLKDPECVKPRVTRQYMAKPTTYTGIADLKPLPFKMETADKHVQEHLAPESLLRIMKNLKSNQANDQARAAARELAGAIKDLREFRRLPVERRQQLESAGIDEAAWDFIITRRSKSATTFYRDQDHLAEIRKTIEDRCRAGRCDYKDFDDKTGAMVVRLEKDGVQVKVVYCAQIGTECSSPGVVKTYFPECGPGLYRFSVANFLDSVRSESYGAAARALEAADCKGRYASR